MYSELIMIYTNFVMRGKRNRTCTCRTAFALILVKCQWGSRSDTQETLLATGTGGAKCKETAADCCKLLLTAADCC